MRHDRIVAVLAACLMGVGGTVLLPTVADAFSQSATVIADMNGDGLLDQVQLGPSGRTTCSVTVSPGVPGGGYGLPTSYTYTSAETSQTCPNVAVAVKLGSETTPDLVTGFGFGGNDLVVLHNYAPVATYHGVIQPYWLQTADINGDGRQDLIEYTGQQNDLTSLVNNADGTLSGGSIGSSCAMSPQFALADFNGDGGQDMLLSDNCQTHPATPISAEVLFGNGQASVVLASTTDYLASWTVSVVDHNGDGIPDAKVVEVGRTGASVTQYFQNDGAGHFTLVP
jgi:hypothetical protein